MLCCDCGRMVHPAVKLAVGDLRQHCWKCAKDFAEAERLPYSLVIKRLISANDNDYVSMRKKSQAN